MKQKKLLPVLCALAMLAAGCAQGQDSLATENPQTMPQSFVEQQPQSTENKMDVKLVTAQMGLLMSGVAPAQNGCYEIVPYTDASGDIVYYDYKTRQKIFLSNQPDKGHDLGSTSYIDNILGGVFPVATDNKLFIFKTGSYYLTTQQGEKGAPYILQMDFNGANRKKINIPSHYELSLSSAIAAEGESLYCIFTIIDSKSRENDKVALVQVEANTGKMVELYAFDLLSSVNITGAYEENIVMQVSRYQSDPSKASPPKLENETELMEYSLRTGKMRTLKHWKIGELSTVIHDNSMYYIENNTALKKINFKDGSTEIVEEMNFQNPSPDNIAIVDQVRDNKILLRLSFADQTTKTIFFDLINKKISEFELYFEEEGITQMVGIFAETEDFFLVCTGTKKKT